MDTSKKSLQTVRLFGTLHIVFASLAILMMLGTLATTLLLPALTGKPVPDPLREQWSPGVYLCWMVGGYAVNIGWPALMLTAGFWLTKGLDKGRRLNTVWAIGSIVLGTGFTVLSAFWITPMVWDAQQKAAATPNLPPAFYQTMKQVMPIVQLVAGLAMSWVYQVLSLVKLNRPEVKAVLR